jgi:rubrerythrin
MADGNAKLLETLATALEMEEKGRAFYAGAMKGCANDLGRDIFKMLMEDEIVHGDRFRKLHAEISKGQKWSAAHDLKPRHDDVGKVFAVMAEKHGPGTSPCADDIRAIETGITMEMTGIAYYQDAFKRATDPTEKKFLERLIAEERGHYAALTAMRTYLTDPAAYFAGRESSGLDGA